MDGLLVDLTGKDERLVAEVRIHVQGAREDAAHDVFDELRVVVRLIHHEELVRAFQQVVRLAGHRVFDDLDEILGANHLRVALVDTE